jgi:hypothetical protein
VRADEPGRARDQRLPHRADHLTGRERRSHL